MEKKGEREGGGKDRRKEGRELRFDRAPPTSGGFVGALFQGPS